MAAAVTGGLQGLLRGCVVGIDGRGVLVLLPERRAQSGRPRRRRAGQEFQAEVSTNGVGGAFVAGAAFRHQHRLLVGQATPRLAEPERERPSPAPRSQGSPAELPRGRSPLRVAADIVDHERVDAVAHRHDDLAAQPSIATPGRTPQAALAHLHLQAATSTPLPSVSRIEQPLVELAVVPAPSGSAETSMRLP